MSTTDELRRLLDERGVEYETYIEQPTGFEHVKWNFNEHGSADFNLEFGEPWLTMYGTISGPEQAIAATLGRGECEQEEGGWTTEGDHARVWLTCGHSCMVETVADLPKFCPECGKQVKVKR